MPYKVGLRLSPRALEMIDELRAKLRDAEETLSAIHSGAVDALVVAGPSGTQQVYTLKGADQPYRVLVENMNEGALTLSADGVILYCNARMAAMVGRPLQRMMGRKLSSFMANGDGAIIKKLLRSESGPRKATVKLRLADGAVPAQLSMTPLDLDGTRAFSAIVTDLTEAFTVRQAMLQKDAGLRLVAAAAPAILFTADSRGRVLSAAGAALKDIHGRVKALLSAPVAGSPKRVSAVSFRLQAVRTGSASYDAYYANRLWNVSLERLGIGGVIGIAVDVTDERRKSENAHSASRERLQRDLIGNVSHEFRTPLSAIQGCAQTLLGGALEDKKNARSFVRTIERQASSLAELVEDLLYLASVESGHLKSNPRPVDIGRLVRRMAGDVRAWASRQKVAIEVSIPKGIEIFADAAQVRRVCMKVVVNAIRYNREGGRLSFSAEQADGHVTLTVADTGIGIKASELPLIFDRFHRARNARGLSIKGAGLGLSIAKTLIERNKGRIRIESRLGKGTSVQIRLPSRA